MKRKVIKQGATTLMVSLPSKWVKQVNLKKGDEVQMAESDDTLIISKGEISTKKQTTITVASLAESSIRVAVWNTYRAGYDQITVKFSTPQQYRVIKDTVKNYMIGFEITQQMHDYCVIENITEPAEEQFDVLFRKVLQNISLLINVTEDRLHRKLPLEDYQEIVSKIHQYDNFCRRVMTKKRMTEAPLLWSFLTLLVHGQRELYHLNRILDKEKIQFTHFAFFDQVKKVYQLLYEGYTKKSIPQLQKIHEVMPELYQEFYKLIQKNQKENVILYHIIGAIRNFYLAASPAMGVLLSQRA
jgi:phosphate uptake regulator